MRFGSAARLARIGAAAVLDEGCGRAARGPRGGTRFRGGRCASGARAGSPASGPGAVLDEGCGRAARGSLAGTRFRGGRCASGARAARPHRGPARCWTRMRAGRPRSLGGHPVPWWPMRFGSAGGPPASGPARCWTRMRAGRPRSLGGTRFRGGRCASGARAGRPHRARRGAGRGCGRAARGPCGGTSILGGGTKWRFPTKRRGIVHSKACSAAVA